MTVLFDILYDKERSERVLDLAKTMAKGGRAVPHHLHGQVTDCLAIIVQSIGWGLNPFAVAAATHVTKNGTLGYNSSLITAVLRSTGCIEGQLDHERIGDWDRLMSIQPIMKTGKTGGQYMVPGYSQRDEQGIGVKVTGTVGGVTRSHSVMLSNCHPRQSVQWATNPWIQICYTADRQFSRLFAPEAMLGISVDDDIVDAELGAREDAPRQDVNILNSAIKKTEPTGRAAKDDAPWVPEDPTPITDHALEPETHQQQNESDAKVSDANIEFQRPPERQGQENHVLEEDGPAWGDPKPQDNTGSGVAQSGGPQLSPGEERLSQNAHASSVGKIVVQGEVFDPSIHGTRADGTPALTPSGKLRKRRGSSQKSNDGKAVGEKEREEPQQGKVMLFEELKDRLRKAKTAGEIEHLRSMAKLADLKENEKDLFSGFCDIMKARTE